MATRTPTGQVDVWSIDPREVISPRSFFAFITRIRGEFATQSPPVASEGIVYILEDGLLTAFNETTGAQIWQQNATGTNGSVAVT